MVGPISRKYNDELHTQYSGNYLNRFSFMRDNNEFLHAALVYAKTKILPLQNLKPLLAIEGDAHALSFIALDEVRSLIGNPYSEASNSRENLSSSREDKRGANYSQLVFLGVDEDQSSDAFFDEVKGTPYFAVDLSVYPMASAAYQKAAEDVVRKLEDDRRHFTSIRLDPWLSAKDYAIYGTARMIIDWNSRVRFCGTCGSPNVSSWGGFRLSCVNGDCPTKHGVSNLCFPRTDTCVIVAVLNSQGNKVLLGRGRKFPMNMYSCLAGFIEPGESIEDCVRREVYEEAGVKVGRVLMHASQPWPYPANLMIGCLAEVENDTSESHAIHLGHDDELEDAQWIDVSKLSAMIQKPFSLSATEMFVPPPNSVAYVLLEEACKLSQELKQSL